ELGANFCSCGDFATNHLGTCKHIEFTLGKLEAKRGGKSALEEGYQPPFSEVLVRYGSRRDVQFRPGSECPPELERIARRFFDSDGILKGDAFARFDEFLAQAGQLDHELRCREEVLRFVAEVRDAERRAEILAEAFPRGPRSAELKKLLKIEM